MIRSADAELTKRINATVTLLRQIPSIAEVASVLIQRYGVSKRQAYRYIHQAQRTPDILPVPEQKVVFTVKLPKTLVDRIRQLAKSKGKSISLIVTQALEAFLKKGPHG
jgi:hypothetical protein